MKATQEDYDRLLKQATSMMIALKDIVAVFDRINEILSWDNLRDADIYEAIRQSKATTNDGIRAMEQVLTADALERSMECGHERRFTMHRERKPSLCTMCELEKARKEISELRCELSGVEAAEEIFEELTGIRDPDTGDLT